MILSPKPLTYIIISLVTVRIRNPNAKLTPAPISVNEDILLVENDAKKLTYRGFCAKKLIIEG